MIYLAGMVLILNDNRRNSEVVVHRENILILLLVPELSSDTSSNVSVHIIKKTMG